MVQQVGQCKEERGMAERQSGVGNCGGEVRLAAAIGAGNQQPALGVAGKRETAFVGAAQIMGAFGGQAIALGHERVESEVVDSGLAAQRAHRLEPPLEALALLARAGHRPAEGRVAKGYIRDDETRAAASGT